MRGHEPLIAMRRRGVRPNGMVCLSDHPQPKPLSCGSRVDWWAGGQCKHADITIEATDHPARADLRFVVGMDVSVSLPEPDRMRAFVRACRDAGARRVIGASYAIDHRGDLVEVDFEFWC